MSQFRLPFSILQNINPLAKSVKRTSISKFNQFCSYTRDAAPVAFDRNLKLQIIGFQPEENADIFRKWGCNESDISEIIMNRSFILRMDPEKLKIKLEILRELGITSIDLMKIITRCPRFLNYRMNYCLEERVEYLRSLFGSREMLRKAIIRNPSFFTYDVHNKIKPVVELYETMGVGREDLIPLLLSRPTIIARTSLSEEKLDFIRRTGISEDSKMYKHVVSILAISQIETIREKMANFERFGLLEDEILHLYGRSPCVLTFSVDKIQKNMTFILGTLNLPASVVLDNPFLLYNNLETSLRPRVLLAGKIQELGLVPTIKGPNLFRALRMKEERFVKVFIKCHSEDVSELLMEYYNHAKSVKPWAGSSKKNIRKNFPF